MSVAWVYHEDYLKHDTGAGHPERADRLRAVVQAFEASGVAKKLSKFAPEPCDASKLEHIHTAEHVKSIETLCGKAPTYADYGDTPISRDSYAVALRATGGVLAAVDAVIAGKFDAAFSTHRPPGHHAERDKAMGFCLFNHVAIAADHLTRAYGLERVAIVDFDVHHGNGTQHSLEERADVLFASIHQDPRTLYPGSGFADETGKGAGEGFTLNVPMRPRSGDEAYRAAFEKSILPKLDEFKPQFLLVSAGFDAMAEDPLAQIDLTDAAFSWMTQRLVEVCDKYCDGRIISVLEGGYDLQALGRAAVAHVKALMR